MGVLTSDRPLLRSTARRRSSDQVASEGGARGEKEARPQVPERIAIQVSPGDNVVTLVEEARPGDVIRYMTPEGRRELVALEAVPFGHKAALADLAAGQEVVKYDEVIGTTSRAVRQGEHVHVHNVRSAVQGSSD
jgi:altronate dehydratase small subunit